MSDMQLQKESPTHKLKTTALDPGVSNIPAAGDPSASVFCVCGFAYFWALMEGEPYSICPSLSAQYFRTFVGYISECSFYAMQYIISQSIYLLVETLVAPTLWPLCMEPLWTWAHTRLFRSLCLGFWITHRSRNPGPFDSYMYAKQNWLIT